MHENRYHSWQDWMQMGNCGWYTSNPRSARDKFIGTGRAGQLHTVMGKDTVQLLHPLPIRGHSRLEETGLIVCAV
jgi:hypothetical protein